MTSHRQYRLVIKGSARAAASAALKHGFAVIQVIPAERVRQISTDVPTVLIASTQDSHAVAKWLAEGPSKPPFPDGALLYYQDEETGDANKKVWLAKQGWAVDDDLEGLGRERHVYSVTIKGNPDQAIAAAQAKGFVFNKIVRADNRNGNTVLLVETFDTNHEARIKRWFERNTAVSPYGPFVVGTLLFYWDEKADGPRAYELRGLEGSTPHNIPLAQYDVGEAVINVWSGGRYNKWQVELIQLRNGRPTVVWSEAVEEHLKEDAARVALIRANRIGIVTGLAIDRLRDAVRSHRAGVPPTKSWKVDDDLEGLENNEKAWSVSTLVPVLRGKPSYKYFDDFKDALSYARSRARVGKRLRDGGKAYFILGHNADPRAADTGAAAYRVFRAFLGAEQAPGKNENFTERREFVMVQEANGTLPHDPQKTRWKMNKAYSVEMLNTETGKARKQPRLR